MADIIRPIEPFELTQGFGENPDAYKRFGLAGHNGWDLRTKFPDTPEGRRNILASWLMQFYRQGNEGNDGYGKFFETVCKLKNTWKLTFAHCHEIPGFSQKNEGEAMAISDNTGNSTGAHLHLTVKKIKIVNGQHEVQDYNNGYFGAVNPQIFFDELRAYKKAGTAPSLPAQDLTMTIDGELYTHLVDGATVRKELAIYLKDQGGNGFDDPDHTPLQNFKNHYQGVKSRITSLEGDLNTARTDLEKANVEVINQKDKVANVEAECQTSLKLKNAEIDALKKDATSVEKLKGLYEGTISTLQGEKRELQKAGGIKDLRITELETQLAQCKSGTTPPSGLDGAAIIQTIVDFIRKFLKK